jgi:hypothetical protein
MSIDPTGKLLCAWYRQLREMTDHLITSKSAGQSDAEVSAAFDRELSLWFRKGPRRIIAEFDEQMKTETYRAAEKVSGHLRHVEPQTAVWR